MLPPPLTKVRLETTRPIPAAASPPASFITLASLLPRHAYLIQIYDQGRLFSFARLAHVFVVEDVEEPSCRLAPNHHYTLRTLGIGKLLCSNQS